MAKKIDTQQVKNIAKLARLQLTDEEISKFSTQLSAILEYIEKLNELDTENVEPLAHCLPVKNVFRQDTPAPSLGVEKTLANAPDKVDEFFKVPRILEEAAGL